MQKLNREAGFVGMIRYDEPMAGHTTFRVGGPADVWVRPAGEIFPSYTAKLLERARAEGIPVFILGGGANIVAADRGIRGIVLDTLDWKGWGTRKNEEPGALPGEKLFYVRSGALVSRAARAAASACLGGMEFLSGMPGSVGGALWMNARCYGISVSDILAEAEVLDESLNRVTIPADPGDFGYKISPFQGKKTVILSASFRLRSSPRNLVRRSSQEIIADRKTKGHYRYPSAGSFFKNNPAFGKSAGAVIDELGLKGLQVGRARVADYHGNFIINAGGAAAADIRALAKTVAARVEAARGIKLEEEVLYVGDWEDSGEA
jgi:UDP-N-acetylmuramate dehydrogenase